MKAFVIFSVFCLVAVAQANYGYHSPTVYAVPAQPIYAPAYIPTTVKVAESHYSYPVPEHKFTRTDYETPGATYAIPAVKTYTVTKPGYTTYLQSAITKAHVTTHQVAGPTIYKPIIAPVVTKALAPILPAYHAAPSYGHGSY